MSLHTFNFSLEQELWKLHEELAAGAYQPGRYFNFTIYEPKRRLISAAPYRDRVVHHALHNILEPIFDPTLRLIEKILDSHGSVADHLHHPSIHPSIHPSESLSAI